MAGSPDLGSLDFTTYTYGFRVAMVPEPGTGLLLLVGMLGLAGRRGRRA
jgi:hypothetical protein